MHLNQYETFGTLLKAKEFYMGAFLKVSPSSIRCFCCDLIFAVCAGILLSFLRSVQLSCSITIGFKKPLLWVSCHSVSC